MSLLDLSRWLGIVCSPESFVSPLDVGRWVKCITNPSFIKSHYKFLRPHHLLALYATYKALAATVAKNLWPKILSVLSETSEQAIPLIHKGLIPDFLIRFGIRVQLRDHLNILRNTEATKELSTKMAIVEQLSNMPIALATDEANQQHYEVPAKFYDLCLGPRKKYSSGLWPKKDTTFEESEVLMLELYCERAGIENGMSIVDLGCGWGSLTLHLIERYPDCKITGISNSHSQRDYILKTAEQRGYNVQNITIVTVRKNMLQICIVNITVHTCYCCYCRFLLIVCYCRFSFCSLF
jgi:methylase of polypeptide subunit release factors